MDRTIFEDDDVNEEVKNMIDLGLLKSDWADGLNRHEARSKFQRILSTGEEPSCNLRRPFDDDNVSDEIHQEVHSYNLRRPFDDDNVHDEIRNMKDLGLLDRAVGLNRREVHDECEQIYQEVHPYNLPRPFDDDNMHDEIKNMRDLGLFESNSADGFNRQEILSAREAREGAVGRVNKRTGANTNWPDSMNTQKPQNLYGKRTTGSGRGKKFKLKRLSPEDPVFKQISANFTNIQSIKAIQIVTNKIQQKIFEIEQKFLKECHSDFNLNIKDLYHGTVVSKDDICTSGLDLRLSRQGFFGKGIYFSDDIKKCEKYLSKEKRGSIYVCSVILGDMKEYPFGVSNKTLKIEPKKPNGDIYNSVKGNIDGYNEYVIYENRRSLIKYRIALEDDGDDDDDDDDEDEEEGGDDTDELDDESNSILKQFLKRTDCDDEEFAKMILKGQNFDLENSISYYQAMMGS